MLFSSTFLQTSHRKYLCYEATKSRLYTISFTLEVLLITLEKMLIRLWLASNLCDCEAIKMISSNNEAISVWPVVSFSLGIVFRSASMICQGFVNGVRM